MPLTGVNVDLTHGTASGGDGSGTLTVIYTLFGSAFNDRIRAKARSAVWGDDGDAVAAALTGLSDFHGGAGDDLAGLWDVPHGTLVETGVVIDSPDRRGRPLVSTGRG
jgi:hypothetical protein